MSARTAGVPALKSNKSERLTPPLVGHEVGHRGSGPFAVEVFL